MTVLIEKLFVFVALMLVGYGGARIGKLSPEFTKGASYLTLQVFTSATVLNAVIVNPPLLDGAALLYTLLVCLLTMLVGYLAAGILSRVLPIRRDRAPLFELLIAVMNPMFIGVPVVDLLYGPQAVFYVALANVFFNLLLFTYGVWRLKSGDEGGVRLKDVVSPILIVTILSVVLFSLRLPVPGVLKDLIASTSGATMPVSMVVIGSCLGGVSPREALKEKSIYLVALFRLVLVPCLTWLMFLALPAEPILRAAMVIMSACPSGVVVSILAIQYGRDAEYCSKATMLNTALSMLTIPLVAAILV